MQIGMIGLGRMGAGMAERLMCGGQACVADDHSIERIAHMEALGATGARSLSALVQKLRAPRVVWLMVPAAAFDAVLDQLEPLLSAGDTIIDGGKSHLLDDVRRAAAPFRRFTSRGRANFTSRMQSAMRQEFGGHVEKRAGGQTP